MTVVMRIASLRAPLTLAQLHPHRQRRPSIRAQAHFTLIKVKVLLCSLLNGFRDLTLMGVMAFDFNHLNNVLISRDWVGKIGDFGLSESSRNAHRKWTSGHLLHPNADGAVDVSV